jgi:hypothetical protein
MLKKNESIKSCIIRTTLKSLLIDELFKKKYIINDNKQIYIPDELVFIIKTFVFYDLNVQSSSSKYYNTMVKKLEIMKKNEK